jgi:hypothetical protein
MNVRPSALATACVAVPIWDNESTALQVLPWMANDS